MTGRVPSLEDRLRSALIELSPRDSAPTVLRERVLAIAETPRRRWFATPTRAYGAGLIAAGLVAAAVAAWAVAGPLRGNVSVGTGGVAPAAMFDPRAEGPGLLYGVWPTLLIIPGLVALTAIVLAVRHLLRARWVGGWIGALRLAILGTVAAVAIGISLHPGFQWLGGGYGPVLGYGFQVRPPIGSLDDSPVYYENVPPGDPLVVRVSITNPGPLPIRIEGLVEDPNVKDMVITRWVGMTAWSDASTLPDLARMPAFTPVTVEPGMELTVYLAARAGQCSFGPDFTVDTTDPDVSGYSNRGRIVQFAYSVFGLMSTAPFELPMTLVEPMRNRCP